MTDQPRHKDPVSFRLSPDALRLLREMGGRLGLSQASVVEMALRLLAEEKLPPPNKP